MKQNKYDDPAFFGQYSQMERSQQGLAAAGEWPALRALLPELLGARVLDLGCGFGWHCRHAIEQGAQRAVGVDISRNMLKRAREMTRSDKIEYVESPIEDYDPEPGGFELVLSSLALHYVADYGAVCKKAALALAPGGRFLFSVEHPVFTARAQQSWVRDDSGNALYWPVDNYFSEGRRDAVFLGESIVKYHRTLTSYVNGLLQNGFVIEAIVEPQPTPEMLSQNAAMGDELRRPMMLILKGQLL